jgi:hypothetical protein
VNYSLTKQKKETLIMRQNKLFSAAIALCLIALFTVGWKPIPARMPSVVTITCSYNFSTFPNVTGTFVTTGALTISGTTTMLIHPMGKRAHCDVVLTASDGSGTITIDQECEFAGDYPNRGQWQIQSGTGAYTNLKGNGPLTMPGNEEAMTGVIY